MSECDRRAIIYLVTQEMNRTDENAGSEEPAAIDYISDVIRHLNNLLPADSRFKG